MLRLSRTIGVGYLGLCLVTALATVVFGPLGYAPLPVLPAAARPPIALTVWYSTEKRDWLEEATRRFAATNPTVAGRPVQVTLRGMGSGEMADRVARRDWGSAPPAAISPASSVWLEKLRPGDVAADDARPLVLTPLVLVGWEDRSRALWPDGPRQFWQDLHDAIANPQGWSAIPGGQAAWGPVKLGQTSPATSNSGAQALYLMAHGFFQRPPATADASDQAFLRWLGEVQAGVPERVDSTGTLMDDLVRIGPSKYDFALVYENLALERLDAARQRHGQSLRIFYPPATLLSDHPYAPLRGDWVTRDQQAAAERFRDFLVARPQQELALQYGFRPSDPNIALTGGQSPFAAHAAEGARADLPPLAPNPSAAVMDALIDAWRRLMNK